MHKVPLIFAACLTLAGCASGPDLIERNPVQSEARFDAAALLIASDLDMAATGYADAKLRPLKGQRDTITVLQDIARGEATRSSMFASQSVVGWPGPMTRSVGGDLVYIVETQAEIDDEIEKVEDPYNASPGRQLTTISIADMNNPQAVSLIDVCRDPAAVDAHSSGKWLVVGCRDAKAPLNLVLLDEAGIPASVKRLPIDIPATSIVEERPGFPFSHLSPDGRIMALNLGGLEMGFAELVAGEDGLPASAQMIGDPVAVEDSWMAMGRWSSDGRFYVTADTGWGPGSLDAVTNSAGTIVSIAFSAEGDHTIASRIETSLSPEGMDFDPTGTLLAVANMERTYLPEGLPYSLFGRRNRSSLSLVRFEPADGSLEVVDGPVAFDGVLPEDIVFDDDGDMLAVVSFQEKSETPQAGWVEFFAVVDGDGGAEIQPTGKRIQLPRGSHDLLVIRSDR